jgi:hypothetical protein
VLNSKLSPEHEVRLNQPVPPLPIQPLATPGKPVNNATTVENQRLFASPS